ncbi:MAG TPA: serine/threonine-protein kinase [Terriglobales bacterium]|nr:serine/threonine-protein kinase [Terriglobales bacterium]
MPNKIGRFEIVSEIAHCDASSVYKATDTESKQTVAVKVIRLEPLGEQKPALLKTILDEAEASKVLNSHNIALLYGAGEIDGNLCASLEYVQGNSVATMLARKEGFSIWDLQDIARQACQGLDHAHVRKVFHYGLEPAKVMVQWDGIVKVLGFGVSSIGQFAAQASGQPPQILHYVSPEQLNGDPIDARSNLFSLGAILYEMVTERKAFEGENADQVRQAILEATPTPIDEINRKVHPALKSVIAKALAKAPEERYQSGQELVNDLEKCKESAVKASTTAKAPTPKPAGKPVQAPAAQAALSRAAAAGRGVAGSSASPKVPSTFPTDPNVSAQPASMSAAVSDRPEVQTPKIAVDPMMDESKQHGSSGRSFSEIDELPPLKEVYVAPAPPPPPQESQPDDAVKAVVFNRATVSKPKVNPADVAKKTAEAAKKAVGEIKQTPPQMFIYSIAAAAAVILLVVAGIAYHIHSGESDDDSVPPPAQTAAATPAAPAPAPAPAPQPAQSAEPAPAPVEVPQQITPQPPVEEVPAVSVTPKHDSKVSRKKTRTPKSVAPSIVAGQLSIDSNPHGAQIAIDGKTAASTPSNIASLLPGHHTITLSKPGYATETRTIDVTSGSKSVISVQLAPTTATVAANSDPTGATVWIDGRDTGRTTPVQISVDKPGNHTVVFKKQGYLDETATANVQIGQTLQLAPTLRPLGVTDEIKVGGKFKKVFGGSETAGMGTVSVKTQPKGAQVAVNSRIVDKPSPVEFYLNPGNYIIDITMSGFKTVEKVVTVEKNGKVVIDQSMDRE